MNRGDIRTAGMDFEKYVEIGHDRNLLEALRMLIDFAPPHEQEQVKQMAHAMAHATKSVLKRRLGL